MSKIIRINLSIVMIVLFLFLAAGCASQNAGASDGLSVKTAVSVRHPLESTVDVAGVLVPQQVVNITGKIGGQVTELKPEVGDSVKAGDVLLVMETKTLNAQLQQAEAALQSAEAAVQSAGDQGDQARINLNTAQKAYDRTKALFDSGAASQSQMDDVASKLELAKKQFEIAGGSALKQAQASVVTANANINNIKVQLENATITSPVSGIVTNRNINPGEIAAPGAVLFTIADTSTLKLKGTVPQDVIPLLQEDQAMDVKIDVYPNKTFKGTISSIGPMAVSTGEYFPIEIGIKNDENIKAGLTAHTTIGITAPDSVAVPVAAVVTNNGRNFVYVIKDGKAEKRFVTLGMKNDKEYAVLNGINEGEAVAISNVNSLFDGMAVKTE